MGNSICFHSIQISMWQKRHFISSEIWNKLIHVSVGGGKCMTRPLQLIPMSRKVNFNFYPKFNHWLTETIKHAEYLHNEQNNKKRAISKNDLGLFRHKTSENMNEKCASVGLREQIILDFNCIHMKFLVNLLRNLAKQDPGSGFMRNTHFVIGYHLFLFTCTNFFSGHGFFSRKHLGMNGYFFVIEGLRFKIHKNSLHIKRVHWFLLIENKLRLLFYRFKKVYCCFAHLKTHKMSLCLQIASRSQCASLIASIVNWRIWLI